MSTPSSKDRVKTHSTTKNVSGQSLKQPLTAGYTPPNRSPRYRPGQVTIHSAELVRTSHAEHVYSTHESITYSEPETTCAPRLDMP